MTENDILRARYRARGFDQVADFVRSTNSEITQESWGKILKRDGRASTELMLRMASELECPPDEIKQMLLMRGEKSIAKIIAPDPLSPEERKVLDCFRSIQDQPKMLTLFSNLLETLRG